MTTIEKLKMICTRVSAIMVIEYSDDKFMIRFKQNSGGPDFMAVGLSDIDAEVDKIALFFGLDLKDLK